MKTTAELQSITKEPDYMAIVRYAEKLMLPNDRVVEKIVRVPDSKYVVQPSPIKK